MAPAAPLSLEEGVARKWSRNVAPGPGNGMDGGAWGMVCLGGEGLHSAASHVNEADLWTANQTWSATAKPLRAIAYDRINVARKITNGGRKEKRPFMQAA